PAPETVGEVAVPRRRFGGALEDRVRRLLLVMPSRTVAGPPELARQELRGGGLAAAGQAFHEDELRNHRATIAEQARGRQGGGGMRQQPVVGEILRGRSPTGDEFGDTRPR